MKRAMIASIVVMLAGCSPSPPTTAQREYQAMVSNAQTAAQTFRSCSDAVYNSSQFAPIRAHYPESVVQATPQQLADQDYATGSEIKTILQAHPQFAACRTDYLNQLSQPTPTLATIETAAFAQMQNKLIGLIQKKLTWGQFLRQLQDITRQSSRQFSAEAQRIAAGLEQSNEAELARRQAAADAYLQYQQTQQIINNMNSSVNTN